MMSELEDIINFTFPEDNITKALGGNDESYPIMIKSEEESISSDENTKLIPS